MDNLKLSPALPQLGLGHLAPKLPPLNVRAAGCICNLSHLKFPARGSLVVSADSSPGFLRCLALVREAKDKIDMQRFALPAVDLSHISASLSVVSAAAPKVAYTYPCLDPYPHNTREGIEVAVAEIRENLVALLRKL